MPNRYNPDLKQPKMQHAPQAQEREGHVPDREVPPSGEEQPKKVYKGLRKWILYILGAEYLRKIDFRKNLPFILLVVAMLIFLVYQNLLTLSKQKKLEMLDKERIELNDKYAQIMEQRETLYVDSSRQDALLEIFREKGFVDDSSIVYDIHKERKGRKR